MAANKHYPDVEPNPNFPKLEEDVLAYWQAGNLFRESVKKRPAKADGKNNEFIFYDGPPFANGLPHYGHLLTGFVKDLYARYQTMRGKRVERRFGWDCHGLPAEMGSEKELGISGRQAIQHFGIDKFNEHCRTSVMKYAHEWEHYVTRQARWVDFAGDYKTMDINFMESVLWAFKQLYEKDLIFEAYRVMPYSWAAETPLSNFETKLDNSYRDREDKAITVAFELKDKPKGAPEADKYYVLAWTTTPWTLPSNLALAVGKEVEYYAITSPSNKGACVILARSACVRYSKAIASFLEPSDTKAQSDIEVHLAFDNLDDKNALVHFEGRVASADLIGLTYKPLFPYFADHADAFRILDGSSFVSDGDGTGIVHMAPGFGEEDQKCCEKNGIKIVVPVDEKGRFTSEIFDLPGNNSEHANLPPLKLNGLNVIAAIEKDASEPYDQKQLEKFGLANLRIIDWLKLRGQLIKNDTITHSYPHCWRTDKPLIYRALPSWYVKVTAIRDRAVELNKQINWIPEHIRDGQMGHMLATAPDWSISRNRFWGTPIPVWRSDNPANKTLYVFGSIKELEDFFGEKVTDLHRPYIDNLTKTDPFNPQYTIKRVEDVFDCWFESGSMPFAQVHYPFENKDWFETHFPADFITEYVGQTRGWFNTLIILATALFDKPPFRNCICHGVVLDAETGLKYSKRLKNYKDPLEVIDQFGADALRWLMIASPVMRGQDLMVDPDGKFIRDVVRLYIKPIWNAYNFFCLYANADNMQAQLLYTVEGGRDRWRVPEHPMDRYILAKLADALIAITDAMDGYDTPEACQKASGFFEDLNNWYIRRTKPRFWKDKKDRDKQDAYDTLYTCLHVMVRALAPLLPMTCEEIYLGLTARGERKPEASVHLAEYPYLPGISQVMDSQIRDDMDRIKDICNAALSVRNTQNLRVRLPLASLTVVAKDYAFPEEFADIIRDEVNVKEVLSSPEFDEFATLKLQVHFPKIGARLGQKTKEVAAASKKGDWKQLPDGGVEVAGEMLMEGEFDLQLLPRDNVKNSAAPLASNDALVVLDTNVTPQLEREGIARDVIRMIQQARKDAGLHVSDRIELTLVVPPQVAEAVKEHQGYISDQTLANSVALVKEQEAKNNFIAESALEDYKISIALSKAA